MSTVYSLEELAAVHAVQFQCNREMVMAAFWDAHKQEATLEEAKRLVERFRNKEVK